MKRVHSSCNLLDAFMMTFGRLFFLIILGLLLDSVFIAKHFSYGQEIANLLIFIVIVRAFLRSTKKVKELILYSVFIGVVGEYLFSKGIGMYTYRLENIPHYVPIGHALLFLTALYFTKARQVRAVKKKLEQIFTIVIICYAAYFLIFLKDYYGVLLTVFTLLILQKFLKERLFFLSLYLIVAGLEIVGTYYECWWWPKTLLDKPGWLLSNNPPCGISFFYFGLEVAGYSLYKLRHFSAWKRKNRLRTLRRKKQLITASS